MKFFQKFLVFEDDFTRQYELGPFLMCLYKPNGLIPFDWLDWGINNKIYSPCFNVYTPWFTLYIDF